jgi:hypothetical protein
MRKHLVIATYDGIGTYYSGVGTKPIKEDAKSKNIFT